MLLCMVDSVADDEDVLDRETDDVGSDFDLTPARLVDERASPNRVSLWSEQVRGELEGSAGVGDVVDEENLSKHADGRRANQAEGRGFPRRSIAAQSDELDTRRQAHAIERANQVRDEHEASLQDADDGELTGEGLGDLGRDLPHASLDLLLVEELGYHALPRPGEAD